MGRFEFERCTPEHVGIPSKAVLRLLDKLEDDHTEIHSLMIWRHGKVCAEGWWSPYAPGLRHTMMSCSKTFSGTAIGIGVDEGVLSLDEKIVDIFPEYLPAAVSDNLRNVTIRHLLCMGSGVKYENPVGPDWIKTFFSIDFVHKPGTDFLYNNAPATLLAAIITKKTGLSLEDYLKPRLFDKIGIDADNLRWFHAPDGTTFAPGGLHCTTEDLLRLMILYKNKGIWNGEQVLPAAYIDEATRSQISTAHIFGKTYVKEETHRISDNAFGYGYMMWMSRFPGVYRAEGANGQFGIVFPEQDMVIAITQSSPETPVSQTTLDQVWEFAAEVKNDLPLQESIDTLCLQNRLARLAIPAEPYAPFGSFPHPGIQYVAESDGAHPESLFYDPIVLSPEAEKITGITAFSFDQETGRKEVCMKAIVNGERYEWRIPTDGNRRMEEISEIYLSLVALSGYWKDTNVFIVRFRWLESVFVSDLEFAFMGDSCTVSLVPLHGDFPCFTKPVIFSIQEKKEG